MLEAAPRRIEVGPDGHVECPRRGRVALATCRDCPALHGTLEGIDVVVLCGGSQDRPALTRRVLRQPIPVQADPADVASTSRR